jgi:hypothetical protein
MCHVYVTFGHSTTIYIYVRFEIVVRRAVGIASVTLHQSSRVGSNWFKIVLRRVELLGKVDCWHCSLLLSHCISRCDLYLSLLLLAVVRAQHF